jgi:hypothetical protein
LTDCGNTCGPCSTICKKLNEGGSLDITFIPVGYTSSKDQNSKNNFNDWVKRSEEEKNNLLTTPPFNNGHITIWRLDAFRTNKAFEEKWLNNDENSFRSAWQDFRGICPGSKNTPNDLVYFLATGGIGSMSAGYYAAILVDEKVNSISHETGHTVCKLKDEYILFPESLIENQPINCDKDPVLLSDGSYKCKWQYDPNSDDEREKLARINYPYDYIYAKDAGCIPGCYNQKYYRPAFPETSIMNTEVRLGVGTFNEISKQACLYELNKYKK